MAETEVIDSKAINANLQKEISISASEQLLSPGQEITTSDKNSAPYDSHLRKRKKTRRGRSKRSKVKPYFRKYQDSSGKECVKLSRGFARRNFLHGQPVAPYNTTQFLIDDHNATQNLEVRLQQVASNTEHTLGFDGHEPSRVRDSSFSFESDEDHFYSSPEDEEEFLTKEFSNAYEDQHAESLNGLTKTQLIQAYLQLEQRIDALQKSDACQNGNNPDLRLQDNSVTKITDLTDLNNTSLPQELSKLIVENKQLRSENDRLRMLCRRRRSKVIPAPSSSSSSSSSSVDSESDSPSSTSQSSENLSAGSESNDCKKEDSSSSENLSAIRRL